MSLRSAGIAALVAAVITVAVLTVSCDSEKDRDVVRRTPLVDLPKRGDAEASGAVDGGLRVGASGEGEEVDEAAVTERPGGRLGATELRVSGMLRWFSESAGAEGADEVVVTLTTTGPGARVLASARVREDASFEIVTQIEPARRNPADDAPPGDTARVATGTYLFVRAESSRGRFVGVSASRPWDDASGPEANWWFEVAMRRAVPVTVVAVDAVGDPVAGAVALFRPRPRDGLQGWEHGLNTDRPTERRCDAVGRARMFVVDGPLDVAVRRDREPYGPSQRVLIDGDAPREVTVRVAAAVGSTTLRLVDQDGTPVTDAIVAVEPRDALHVWPSEVASRLEGVALRTVADGTVSFRFALASRPFLVGVAHPRHRTTALVVSRDGDRPQPVEVVLGRRTSLDLAVVRPGGEPAPFVAPTVTVARSGPRMRAHGADLRLIGTANEIDPEGDNDHPCEVAERRCGRPWDGALRESGGVALLPRPGTYAVTFSVPGAGRFGRSVRLAETDAGLREQLELPPGREVAVDLAEWAGVPLSYAVGDAERVSVTGWEHRTPSSGDSVLRLWVPHELTRLILFEAALDGDPNPYDVSLPAGDVVDSPIPLVRRASNVPAIPTALSLSMDDRPIAAAGVAVRIRAVDRQAAPRGLRVPWTTLVTDTEGRVRAPMRPGRYRYRAVIPGGPHRRGEFTVDANTSSLVVDVPLDAGVR